MDIVYTDKCRYKIEEYKEVPVPYTGICRPITDLIVLIISREMFDVNVSLSKEPVLC
jgi:hypothetical protein